MNGGWRRDKLKTLKGIIAFMFLSMTVAANI